jgi:hypothetical protein
MQDSTVRLCTTENTKNAKAPDYMFNLPEKPPFVYKYCSADRAIQIVQTLTFYFAAASQLNDLFEFRVNSVYHEDPDSKFRVFGKRLLAEGWFSDPKEALAAAKSMDSGDIDSTYASFITQLRATTERVMRCSGVCSFTSERNNQRMWGTYGDNQAGAVLEFSTDSNLSRFASHLMPVIYTTTKLPICPSELITDPLSLDKWMIGVFLCVKHSDWRDEREWRLLLLADVEQVVHDRIVRFERSAFTRIFVGPRIAREKETLIRESAAAHTPNIPVFKREIDDVFAKEEYTGVETISSVDQLLYWAKNRPRP